MIKAIQVYFFYRDLDMTDFETGVSVVPRSSDLTTDLGNIQFLFTDKTGTLTRNEMVLKTLYCKPGETLDFPVINYEDLDQDYSAVMLNLITNHSVIPDIHGGSIDDPKYGASSPDEAAFLNAIYELGYILVGRAPNFLELRIQGHTVRAHILFSVEFDSNRKRSSVVVKFSEHKILGNFSGKVFLFCKGADSTVLPLCSSVLPEEEDMRFEYSSKGMRVLLFAYKEISATDTKHLLDFLSSSLSLEEESTIDCMNVLEEDLHMCGVSAIEDKLQDGVEECLFTLKAAGITIWMLTGDHIDTAVNIAISSRLLGPDSSVLEITSRSLEENFDSQSEQPILERMKFVFNEIHLMDTKPGVAIDGETLDWILENNETTGLLFSSIVSRAEAILLCRASPLQKEQIVELVRNHSGKLTLAVGDGANDCAMIQKAHIGIGIMGKEGLQAFNSSDYGISQFRFLRPLLLSHGRWCYKRNTTSVMYLFYKNFSLVIPNFLFATGSLWSGQKIYPEMMYQLFNVVLTALPIISFGVFDQDVPKIPSMCYPILYEEQLITPALSFFHIFIWVADSVWVGFVCFYLPSLAMGGTNITSLDGLPNSLFLVGSTIMFAVCLCVNLKIVIIAHRRNFWIETSVVLSVCAFILFLGIFSLVQFSAESTGVLFRILCTPLVYFLLIGGVIIGLAPSIVGKVVFKNFYPGVLEVVQRLYLNSVQSSKRLGGVTSVSRELRESRHDPNFAFAVADEVAVDHIKKFSYLPHKTDETDLEAFTPLESEMTLLKAHRPVSGMA
eukprot:GHVP01046246.1.p1 GENE.GHVP01046246.1~~GHVP01046246.1.p1  ORF type:complete len:784 (+),score=131.15 GHVP01046246.1:1381-3732(+)